MLLLWHLAPSPQDLRTALTVVDLPDQAPPEERKPPPPPPPQPAPKRGSPKRGEQGAPGKQAEAAPLAAAIPIELPKYVPAPIPGTGLEASAGAAAAGSGSGAGGTGSGSGGGGNGNGGGLYPKPAVDAQVIRGSFKKSDYPRELREQGPKGTTWAEVTVGTNGRVTSCRVSRQSGIPQFDAKTCQILLERFRYRPARDAAGRAVEAADSFSVDWDYIDLNDE
ncbi:MAG: TonB family protein [Novosphingobium sp.]